MSYNSYDKLGGSELYYFTSGENEWPKKTIVDVNRALREYMTELKQKKPQIKQNFTK